MLLCIGGAGFTLRGYSLGTSTAYTVYYLNGSSTGQVGQFYFPMCWVEANLSGASIQYLRLTNTNTSATVAEFRALTVAPANIFVLGWNTSAHLTLDPTYTGLYKCTTDRAVTSQTYQLNVVGMYTMTVCIVSYNDETLDIGILSIVHVPKMMTSWQPLPFLV